MEATSSSTADRTEAPQLDQQSRDPPQDPAAQIEPFNWDQLTEQFLADLEAHNLQEEELFRRFEHLTDYFGSWASSMHQSDSTRAVKRVKTRVARVQMSEDSLELKRQHYISVVQAFQTALQLLNGD